MSAGEWFQAAYVGDRKTLAQYATKAALRENVGQYGGYIVPPEVCQEIMGMVKDASPLWSWCPVLPMKSVELNVPTINMTATNTAGNPAWFGGMTMTWLRPDATSLTESDPTFEQQLLRAYVLSGLVLLSNPLFDDTPALESFLKQLAGRAVRWFTEQAFMVGNGIGQPLGMASLANPALLTVQAVSGSLGGNLSQMVSYLSPYSFDSAVWFFHPSYYVKLFARASSTDAVPPNAVSNIPGQNLFGFPAFPFDRLSATSGQPVAALVDPTQYVIGQRLEMEVSFSPHPMFTNNQTYMRIIMRIAGRPLWSSAAKLPDASNDVSPYVALLAI